MTLNMREQYSSSGLSRVERSAEDGVLATRSRLWLVSRVRSRRVLFDDAPHPVDRAVHRLDLGELAGLEGDADDALVDDSGGAAALRDQYFAFQTTTHSHARLHKIPDRGKRLEP